MGDAKDPHLVLIAVDIVLDQISEGWFDEAPDMVDIKFATKVRMSDEDCDRILDGASDCLRASRGMHSDEVSDRHDRARPSRYTEPSLIEVIECGVDLLLRREVTSANGGHAFNDEVAFVGACHDRFDSPTDNAKHCASQIVLDVVRQGTGLDGCFHELRHRP